MAVGHTYDKWVTVRLMTDFLSSAQLGEWVEGGGDITSDIDGFVTTKGQLWCAERVLMTGTAVYKGLERKSGLK
ncbi:MAG: acyl-CoA thioesterase FadM [Parvibaculaceae bacterium]|jgi:acyl-CoA thioesterase FadM